MRAYDSYSRVVTANVRASEFYDTTQRVDINHTKYFPRCNLFVLLVLELIIYS